MTPKGANRNGWVWLALVGGVVVGYLVHPLLDLCSELEVVAYQVPTTGGPACPDTAGQRSALRSSIETITELPIPMLTKPGLPVEREPDQWEEWGTDFSPSRAAAYVDQIAPGCEQQGVHLSLDCDVPPCLIVASPWMPQAPVECGGGSDLGRRFRSVRMSDSRGNSVSVVAYTAGIDGWPGVATDVDAERVSSRMRDIASEHLGIF